MSASHTWDALECKAQGLWAVVVNAVSPACETALGT